jgi:hypothetical protein
MIIATLSHCQESMLGFGASLFVFGFWWGLMAAALIIAHKRKRPHETP